MSQRGKPGRLSAEMITALTAVAIGVGAIGVSLYETSLVRQQLKGSAWPNVEIGYSFRGDSFRYLVVNSGVGPARIQATEVTVDGEPVLHWGELFDRLGLDVHNFTVSHVGRRAVPPDTQLEIVILGSEQLEQPLDRLLASQERIRIAICYCSVYDDCWTSAFEADSGGDPVPTSSCAVDEERQFRN
jgi:hypothetical protein